ncbi:MAG TPA: LDL receptor domain-containing protein, partial [Polyangiaceae bacterium]
AAGPGWIPTGEFGAAADELIAAARDLCEALCISGLCDELTPETLERCVQAELQNFAPSVQWIACTVHTGGDHDLDELASYYRAWARETRSSDCHLVLPPPAPELGECAVRSAYRIPCPGTESTLNFCDGEAQCADGYDERNCDPAAEAYACGGGEQVEWDALCDGESDCPDGDDEHACEER